jgi:hypothetical protein
VVVMMMTRRAPSPLRSPLAGSICVAALACVACGGKNEGARPARERNFDATGVDDCALAAEFEYLSILS